VSTTAHVQRGPEHSALVCYSDEHVVLRGLYEPMLAELLADALVNVATFGGVHSGFKRGPATVKQAYARFLCTGDHGTLKLYKEHPGAGGFPVTWVRWNE